MPGLDLQISTVVDHARAQSIELEEFLQFMHFLRVSTSVIYAKPVGEWAGRFDLMCTPDDIRHVKSMLVKYDGYDHTSIAYGRNLGCIAVKRIVELTAFGDIMPCPWMYMNVGNVFDTPLADILDKGMRYLGHNFCSVCRLSESRQFNDQYMSKLVGRDLPVPIEEVMG
jgi:hypothetical protein